MTEQIGVRINNAALAGILGVKPGSTVPVKCKNGVPVVREWRNRFRDAETDDCVTILKGGEKSPKKQKEGS